MSPNERCMQFVDLVEEDLRADLTLTTIYITDAWKLRTLHSETVQQAVQYRKKLQDLERTLERMSFDGERYHPYVFIATELHRSIFQGLLACRRQITARLKRDISVDRDHLLGKALREAVVLTSISQMKQRFHRCDHPTVIFDVAARSTNTSLWQNQLHDGLCLLEETTGNSESVDEISLTIGALQREVQIELTFLSQWVHDLWQPIDAHALAL